MKRFGYIGINVCGIPVYMYHENIVMFEDYIMDENRLLSFEEILEYCKNHSIKIAFFRPRKGSKRIYNKMWKMLMRYPTVAMTQEAVDQMFNTYEELTKIEPVVAFA